MKRLIFTILILFAATVSANNTKVTKYYFWFNQEEFRQQQANRTCQPRCLIDDTKQPQIYTRLTSEYKNYPSHTYLGYGIYYDCIARE